MSQNGKVAPSKAPPRAAGTQTSAIVPQISQTNRTVSRTAEAGMRFVSTTS